jgi:hypothetical protein
LPELWKVVTRIMLVGSRDAPKKNLPAKSELTFLFVKELGEGKLEKEKKRDASHFSAALTKKRGTAEKAAPRFSTLSLSLKFRQYILGNNPPQDRHRLKVGRGFLRGLHTSNSFYRWYIQACFSDQLRRAISHERLDAYRQRGTSSEDTELFPHYACNPQGDVVALLHYEWVSHKGTALDSR